MSKEKTKKAPETSNQGLKIDRKTLITLTALLLGVMALAGILTQTIPRGEYAVDAEGTVINGTYERLPDYRLPLWQVLASPVLIFAKGEALTAVAIILFIVLIGGTFLILDKSGVLRYIMSFIVKKYEHKKYFLLAAVVFLLMTLSSVIGILEESLVLVPLAVAIALALGWDSFVGLGMSLVAVAFGYTASTFNPFTVVLVQSLAGIPIYSGLWYRLIFFAVAYTILILFLVRYAKKVETHPKKSLAYESDKAVRAKYAMGVDEALLQDENMRKAARTFVGCLLGVFVAVVVSFVLQNSESVPVSLSGLTGYIPTIAMALLFTIGGLLAGRKAGIRKNQLFSVFRQGVKTIAPAIPMILLVVCVAFVLKEGKIVHTLLYWVYEGIKDLSPSVTLLAIFAFITSLEFFVGSGTAKAFLVLPIVLPLAGMVGLTGQSVLLAFMMSDGFFNIFFPTSGIMIIAIGLVGISYGKYMRWFWKLFALEIAMAVALMLIAVAIGY